jgi:hypothetical protein
MAKTINSGDLPKSMNVHWKWVCALDSWEYGSPEQLSELVKVEPIPDEFKNAVSEILLGNRKPKNRAAAKSKIPASERMKIAATISCVLWLIDELKFGSDEDQTIIEKQADKLGIEPIEVLGGLNDKARKIIKKSAEDLGVSTETIENLLRDLRLKIKNWPIV